MKQQPKSSQKATKILLFALVALLVSVGVAYLTGQTVSTPDQQQTEESTNDQTDDLANEPGDDAQRYIGLPETDAMAQAAESNTPARVIERDGESLPATTDLRPGRLNFTVEDGRVSDVYVEAVEMLGDEE